MKKLLLLPIVLFVMLIAAMVNPFGCRGKKDSYRETFRAMADSANYYQTKWECCFNNKEYDKAEVFRVKQSMFTDSVVKYYALMYPKGNPGEEKKPDCNCN